MTSRQASDLNWKSVYDLVDEKVGAVEDKVDTVISKVANIEGRLMMIPVIISSAIGIFFFIINLIVKKPI